MKTCPYCLSEDLPDASTHCKHCGKRLKPSQAPIVIIIIIVVVALAAWGISALRSATQRDFERSQLKIEMDSMKRVCGPSFMDDQFVDIETAEFEKHLKESSLDFEEQQSLLAVWQNNIAICRSRLKSSKKRR